MPDVDVLVVGAGPAGGVAAGGAESAAPPPAAPLRRARRAAGAPGRVCSRGWQGAATWRGRIVIGAEGVEAMVGRWAGLDTRVPARDMESCAQYVIQGIDFDPDAIYLQFGGPIAPGGYAWLFPKGVGIANVGLGLVALRADGRP